MLRLPKSRNPVSNGFILEVDHFINVYDIMFYAADATSSQFTLWVGTAGGALGVFTVTRSSAGEPLELVPTGVYVCVHVNENYNYM